MIGITYSERIVEAIKQFRKALEIAPHYKAAHFLGQALLFHTHDYKNALSLADEIQESFPEESEHIRQMVEMYQNRQ